MAFGNTLWLDCQSGVAGDMLVAALLDLAEDRPAAERSVREALEGLPVDGFSVEVSRVSKAGLDCCDFAVVLDAEHENHDHDMAYLHGDHEGASACVCGQAHDYHHSHAHVHGHSHRGLPEIENLLAGANLTDAARTFALRTFRILAAAEAEAHGVPMDQVHFHEVGAVDSIADIVAAAVLVDLLGIEHAIVPELTDGHGTIRCQHGVIPVPVPATLNISRDNGLPLSICDVEGELVTPTGAALVAALAPTFDLPVRYIVRRVGLGAGKRTYTRPSILRAMLIEAPAAGAAPDQVIKLECDIDDATGEELGYAADALREAGALEVHWLPIFTKKGRPAYQLQVLGRQKDASNLELVIFRETPTLGIRRSTWDRTVLSREAAQVDTEFGPISVKRSTLPDGTVRIKPEHDDCARAARQAGVSLQEVVFACRKGLQ